MDSTQPANGQVQSTLPVPILAIKNAICFTCYEESSKLDRCGACKRAAYCSKVCQKIDWENGHKKTCKLLIASNKRKTPVPFKGRTWENYRTEKWDDIDKFKASQKPQNYVSKQDVGRLIMYEPYCLHCFRNAPQLEAGESLKSCQTCYVSSFCTACPQTHAQDQCATFQELQSDEIWLIQRHRQSGKSYEVMCTDVPRKDYIPLSTATGWYDYYMRISDKGDFADGIGSELKPVADDPMSIGLAGLLRRASATTSMPLTIIAGLEKVYPDINTRPSIRIHLVGASAVEINSLMIFEELLHLLPNLKSLHMTAIGFDIPIQSTEEMGSKKELVLQCCPVCSSNNRTRAISLFKGAYHEYIKSERYKKPDLAIAFQSGFSQESEASWLPTIRYLVNAPHPTVFTCYNEQEMREESAILANLGAKFIHRGEVNKWKGTYPCLEVPVLHPSESTVYYINQFWYIIGPEGK